MKHNAQIYWFKRRRYGYGWTPVTWQGWLTLAVSLIVVITSGTITLKDTPRNTFSNGVELFLAVTVITVLITILIAHKKGPSPKWRWGEGKNDDPRHDH